MSIVEKALEKLKPLATGDSGRTSRPATAAAAATTASATVVAARVQPKPVPPTVERPKLVIDREALRAAGLLPPESEERRLAAEYRRIKRPLVTAAFTPAGGDSSAASVIMVASSVPGEGKSFTAVNLALSLSLERDATVLLVDADVPKPHISTVLGLRSRPGLVDALVNEAIDVESLIFDTDIPNFSILPAGQHSETAAELLASQRMLELVARLKRADPHRLIVFDSPPLTATAEARELATAAGQVVFVVRAGATPRRAVLDALSQLGADKPVGFVLNQVGSNSTDGSYYGYGQYGTYGEKAGQAE